MKTTYIFLVIFFFISKITSQIIIDDGNNKGLISTRAYNKKITEDFSYLLLGENSPQQGISASFNESKSNIKINGLLFSGIQGILTVEADLAASNGVYFFDKEEGSEQGKVTFNYYKPIRSFSKFKPISSITRANMKFQTLSLLTKALSDYEMLKNKIKNNTKGILLDKDSALIVGRIQKLSKQYINKTEKYAFEEFKKIKYDYEKKGLEELKVTVPIILKVEKGEEIKVNKTAKINVGHLLAEYKKIKKYILGELEEKINTVELENAESQWTGNHIFFLGISPFYERESFKRFQYDISKSFGEMFSKERGNIFGVTLSLSWSYEKGKGATNKLAAERSFVRLSTTLKRASNISNFRTSTLDITGPIGNDVNGNPISFSGSDKAFIGDSVYEHGFGRAINLEAYYYPFKLPVGVFGKIGYQKITFNKGSILNDQERIPMRLGMLFNLKGKEKNKTIVTIQTFMDRTNLNLAPNGNDKGLRFGLGIGLPINIR